MNIDLFNTQLILKGVGQTGQNYLRWTKIFTYKDLLDTFPTGILIEQNFIKFRQSTTYSQRFR